MGGIGAASAWLAAGLRLLWAPETPAQPGIKGPASASPGLSRVICLLAGLDFGGRVGGAPGRGHWRGPNHPGPLAEHPYGPDWPWSCSPPLFRAVVSVPAWGTRGSALHRDGAGVQAPKAPGALEGRSKTSPGARGTMGPSWCCPEPGSGSEVPIAPSKLGGRPSSLTPVCVHTVGPDPVTDPEGERVGGGGLPSSPGRPLGPPTLQLLQMWHPPPQRSSTTEPGARRHRNPALCGPAGGSGAGAGGRGGRAAW